MKIQRPFKKIVWAIDPFAEDLELQRVIASNIQALVSDSSVTVNPVSVIHFEQRGAHGEAPLTIEDVKNSAEAAVNSLIASTAIKGLSPAVILVQNYLSLETAVNQLLNYAKDAKADLIVAGTMARKGATRFLLGSFAEAMILQSRIPILVVTPKSSPAKKIRKILFPSDLTPKSLAMFAEVVELAAAVEAGIIFFHRSEPDASISANELESLLALARRHHVTLDLRIATHKTGAADAIIELSNTPDQIIAMVSQTKLIDSRVMGNITRQVIHHSKCPVWVIHPREQKGK